MISEFKKEFVAAQYECDFKNRLKAAALMRQHRPL